MPVKIYTLFFKGAESACVIMNCNDTISFSIDINIFPHCLCKLLMNFFFMVYIKIDQRLKIKGKRVGRTTIARTWQETGFTTWRNMFQWKRHKKELLYLLLTKIARKSA